MERHLPFYFFRILLCGAISIALLTGCVSAKTGGSKIPHKKAISSLNKIAVFPFQALTSVDPGISVARCPVCGTSFRACNFTGTPEKTIEDFLIKRIESSKQYTLIPSDYVDGVYKRVSADWSGATPLEALTEVGKEIGADGILAGYLFYYKERDGFDYSVESPASVAFCVHLIRVSDGVSLWKGIFVKTQSSLMENLFDILPFVKGGGKWLTAKELSREGVNEILNNFPGLKGDS